ncbi:hypothetical protein [Thiohalobacter thiocyanaticus]|uniref:Uncharacterized protein n=1 Tax=Thiohalobacter thiocyanaticus TaxID=585455 RepID=A0A426QG70_9GAMM|nr:hypothetical protein [Thiohalobacter thiocyanaticus]RRQ20742.1 hypothetical protein D6C00_01265 [Thiohalobacter thiocyanaticus]
MRIMVPLLVSSVFPDKLPGHNISNGGAVHAARRYVDHGEWSSRLAFILAATGSAVGLGNIGRFPYVTGESGGGAFVILYCVCVAPSPAGDDRRDMCGRSGRKRPINTMAVPWPKE